MYKLFTILILLFLASAIVAFSTNAQQCCGVREPIDTTCVPCLDNPLGDRTGPDAEPTVLIGKLINAIMGIVGSIALVMFIFGGLVWMLAAGNTERITRGKNILIWATVGLVVIFSSYAIVKFVLEKALKGG